VTQLCLTYLLTPWCRVFLEKLTGLQLVKKFPAFHGTRRFITALKSVRHLSCCAMLPLVTLPPPGDPSGGVVYLQIVLSPEQASHLWMFLNISVLQGRIVSTTPNPQAGGPPHVGCPRLLVFDYIPFSKFHTHNGNDTFPRFWGDAPASQAYKAWTALLFVRTSGF